MHNYKMIYVWSNYRTFLAETLSVMKLCTRHQAVDPPPPTPPRWHSDDGFAADRQESYYLDQSASPWSHSVSRDELLTSDRTKALEEQ